MHKAVLKNRTVSKQRNADVCNSKQNLMVTVDSIFESGAGFYSGAFNDLCVMETPTKFVCKDLTKFAKANVKFSIGGESQIEVVDLEWKVNADIYVRNGTVTADSVESKTIALVKNSQIMKNVKPIELSDYSAVEKEVIAKVSEQANLKFEKIFYSWAKQVFLKDSYKQSMNADMKQLSPNKFYM